MLLALIFSVGIVAALVRRHGDGPGGTKLIVGIGAFALAVRLISVLVINYYAYPIHDTGVWLADEASFFLATEAIWPDPLNRELPMGLEHLDGDGWLGITTTFAWLGRVADSNTFRVVNAGLGSVVVVLSALVARRLFGPRAALASGAILAVWPTIVLWSSTMLRDTLASVAVVGVWWTLGRARELGWLRTLGAVALSLVIALSLRPYLGEAIAIGVVAWATHPYLRRMAARQVALAIAAGAAVMVVFGIAQAVTLDSIAHELFYRQTVSRMEVLGRLYTDQPDPGPGVRFKPGVAVALATPDGSSLGGIVQQLDGPDQVLVAFTDESVRQLPTAQLVSIQEAPVSPVTLIVGVIPDLVSYLNGVSIAPEAGSPVWVGAALLWDAIALIGLVALIRLRPGAREWLFPLCVIGGTVLALIAVPGAPGNTERHRATQTVPFLVVLASGFLLPLPAQARQSAPVVDAQLVASQPSRSRSNVG